MGHGGEAGFQSGSVVYGVNILIGRSIVDYNGEYRKKMQGKVIVLAVVLVKVIVHVGIKSPMRNLPLSCRMPSVVVHP